MEEYQHVMVKRTYTTKQSGTSSTNKFVERNYIPTRVVTGATTTPAKLQPNLTGKTVKPKPQPHDGDSQVPDPEPMDWSALTDYELDQVAATGLPGGNFGKGAAMLGLASATIGLPATALAVFGRGMNMLEAPNRIAKRSAAREIQQYLMNQPENRQRENTRIKSAITDPTKWDNKNISPRQAKEVQQMLTLGRSLDADSPEGYDDSEASTTMGDTPGSESGTY